MNPRGRIILGMDPGTNLMGYGIVSVEGSRASLLAMGVIRLGKLENHYMRLHRIYERVQGLVDAYHPQEVAIEAPFFGKNVQSMLKLGRAQGVAIAAAMSRGVPVTEYEPRKIKQAITGNGGASKEQVREMLRHMLHINPETLKDIELDATDALGAAMCHFYESQRPAAASGPKNWAAFIAANPDRIKR